MDFNPQSIAPDGTAIFATDSQLMVKFFIHPELSQHKSKTAGTPIYDDVECIEIRIPGEKEPVIGPATEFHKRRFPKAYEAFQKGIEDQQGGTPLELLFPSQPSTVKQLKAFHIFTIQQLSAITDQAMTQIPMGRSLVDRAKEYLRKAGQGQDFHAQEMLQAQIDELKKMLADAGQPVPETPAAAPQRRGPGRPKNPASAEKETA